MGSALGAFFVGDKVWRRTSLSDQRTEDGCLAVNLERRRTAAGLPSVRLAIHAGANRPVAVFHKTGLDPFEICRE
jgi:hypothetical protein